MRAASVIETTLTFPDPVKPRFHRIRLDGRRLTRTSWTGDGRPRETVTELDVRDDFHAEIAVEKARQRKLREGFCLVADANTAARGDVVLEFLVPNGSTAEAFDLSPDGRTIVVGTTLKDAYGAELHLVDLATGARRLLHAEAPAATGSRQTFPHTVFFDADGERVIYTVNGATRLLDPARPAPPTTLASYQEFHDASFNPFRLRPSWNRLRTRLLVFDRGDRVRVLDREWHPVFETHVGGTPYEYWAGALSPRGRLLALSRSRGKTYDDTDPMVTEIEVWDLATGEIRQCVPVPGRYPVTQVGFDPTETLLLVSGWSNDGLTAYRLDPAEPAWRFPEADPLDRPAPVYGWDYSPDGTTLAVGGRSHTNVVDPATRAVDRAFRPNWPVEGRTGRTSRVRISDDGTLVASGGDTGRIVVRRL